MYVWIIYCYIFCYQSIFYPVLPFLQHWLFTVYYITSLNEPSFDSTDTEYQHFRPKSQLIQLQTTTSVTQLHRLFKMWPRGFFRSWECVLLVPYTLRGRTPWLTWTWKLRSRSVTEQPPETAARGCGGRPPAQRTRPEPSDWTAPPEETRLPAHHRETRRKAQEMLSWRDWYWDRGWGRQINVYTSQKTSSCITMSRATLLIPKLFLSSHHDTDHFNFLSEMRQQLLNGQPSDLVQTLTSPSGKTPLTFVTPWIYMEHRHRDKLIMCPRKNLENYDIPISLSAKSANVSMPTC